MTKQGRDLKPHELEAKPLETMKAEEREWDEAEPSEDELPLDPKVQAHLGKIMRAAYQDQLSKAVPDRFLKLLDELHKKESDG